MLLPQSLAILFSSPNLTRAYRPWGHKELDTTERLNWTFKLMYYSSIVLKMQTSYFRVYLSDYSWDWICLYACYPFVIFCCKFFVHILCTILYFVTSFTYYSNSSLCVRNVNILFPNPSLLFISNFIDEVFLL